jgi:hypothetical protein
VGGGVCVEVNTDKPKYVFISRHQNAGHSRNLLIANESFENAEKFKYLRKTITNENDINKEIKSWLHLGTACYHSVQNLFSSRLLSKNLNIEKYKNNFSYMCEFVVSR